MTAPERAARSAWPRSLARPPQSRIRALGDSSVEPIHFGYRRMKIRSWTRWALRANSGRMATGHEPESNVVAGAEESLEAAVALKSLYCQYLDGKDWDRWSALFTEDARMQVGPNADSAVVGREPIRRLLTRQLKQSTTKHVARNPEVHGEQAGRLRVVWEMTDRVETPLYLLEGAGFYEDHYVRTEEGWRIAGVRLHRSKVDLQAKSFVMRAILRMHRNGWLRRLSASADRTLGEALYVGLLEGERP